MNKFLSCEIVIVLVFLLESGSRHLAGAETSRIKVISRAAQNLAEHKGFSGSVLVAESDTVILDASFGFADLNSRLRNTTDNQFRIGSLTKPLTASLILLLQQDGKIQLNDQVANYFTDPPAAWQAISIANLLEHTSGIPDFTDEAGFVTWGRHVAQPS